MSGPRLLDSEATAAVVIGAHDWKEAGLGRAPSFLRSAKGLVRYLIDSGGLGLDPALVLDLFDDPASAGEQLARIRDTLDVQLRERRDEGCPVADVLVYYVGHGHTDDQGHLSLLVRRSRRGMEAETGIKAPDLARVLRVAAPQQRRMIVLDCCFSEAAARDFIGQSGALDQAVAATAIKDLRDDQPRRGTLLLCSSPVGEVSMGAPNAARTLFTGAVLEVLAKGAEGKPSALSFADLRDAAYEQMVVSFGANAPRPVLHQVSAAHGDLTRIPAFPNRTPLSPPAQTPVSQSREESEPPKPSPHPSEPMRSAGENFRLGVQCEARGNDTEAARFFRLAAEQGCAAAQYNLGAFYVKGRGGLPQDLKKAARLYRLAAEQSHAEAQFNLALFYMLGHGGLPADGKEATRFFRLAAEQGHPQAAYSLGGSYEHGLGGLPQDEKEAARFYCLAAEQGHAEAQNSLGVFYAQGRGGLPRDEKEVVRLYRLAAEQGHAKAQTNLGALYLLGESGLPQDEKEAVRFFRLGAEQGEARAQYGLGMFYEHGRGGLPRDKKEAARLYHLAAEQGYPKA